MPSTGNSTEFLSVLVNENFEYDPEAEFHFTNEVPEIGVAMSSDLEQALSDNFFASQSGRRLQGAGVAVSVAVKKSTPAEVMDICSTDTATSCVSSRLVSFDDFDGDDPILGWTNAETTTTGSLSPFLGPYRNKDWYPSKTFTVPVDAEEILLEFIFYEFDNWSRATGDRLWIGVNSVMVDLGLFDSKENEGGRFGTQYDIFFEIGSTDSPRKLGYAYHLDQAHPITMRIPSSYFVLNGELSISFRPQINRDDKVAGFDDIRVTALNRCNNRACVPNQSITFEDFEDGTTMGWTNGKTDEATRFTKFLGRFGKNDPNPIKTYTVPRDATDVVFSFRFLEIDSWDYSQGDGLKVAFNGKAVDLGTFQHNVDEDGRSGTHHGIEFVLHSGAAPTNLAFDSRWSDQIHYVTMVVPNAVFSSDGRLTVEFQVQLNDAYVDESAGFDDIRLTARFDCSNTCAPLWTFPIEDFEDSSLAGWTNGKIESANLFSTFLGRYDVDDIGKNPFKTYIVPQDAAKVLVEFDFYRVDSWDNHDNDSVTVLLNGFPVSLGTFQSGQDDGGRSGTESGISFEMTGQTSGDSNLGFVERYTDQILHVTLFVPRWYFASDGKLKVEFQTAISHTKIDESAGFDNIKISARTDCAITCIPLTTVVSMEDFEDSSLAGWTNGEIDSSTKMTTFLGRYAFNNRRTNPYKTYTIPTTAKEALVEFDFYKIDTWDASQNDSLRVLLNGFVVYLGSFQKDVDSSGHSGMQHGVTFAIDKITMSNKNLGFLTNTDQILRVTLNVPRSYFATDGQLTIEFRTKLNNSADNESAGFDNIKISAIFPCIANDESDDDDDRRSLHGLGDRFDVDFKPLKSSLRG